MGQALCEKYQLFEDIHRRRMHYAGFKSERQGKRLFRSLPPSGGLFYILLQIAPQLAFTPSRKPHEVCPGGTPSFLSRELQSKKAYCDRSSLLYTPLYQCCRESQSIADYYRTSRGLHQVITPYYRCGKDQKILEYALM